MKVGRKVQAEVTYSHLGGSPAGKYGRGGGAGMTYFGLYVIAFGGALFASLLVVAGRFVMGSPI